MLVISEVNIAKIAQSYKSRRTVLCTKDSPLSRRLVYRRENRYIFPAPTGPAAPPTQTMTKEQLTKLLRGYKRGAVAESRILAELASLGPEELGFATVDHHRRLRQGFPEVIFCEGKTPAQVAGIAARIVARNSPLLATRAGKEHAAAVRRKVRGARYDETARTITANGPRRPDRT